MVRCLLGLALLLAGCDGFVPVIDPLSDLSAPVGEELAIGLHASGGPVVFDFASPDLADLKHRSPPATMTNYAGGLAVFRWTPLAADIGTHELSFTASGGSSSASASAAITVTPGSGASPIFRQPTGEGTTLDLGRTSCATVDVVVEATESAVVDLALAPPLVPNVDLQAAEQAGQAILGFCPSSMQVAESLVYPFTLSADDGVHPKVLKPYTIVVRPPPLPSCTTLAPTLTTTPHANLTTTGNLHIYAVIGDDLGVVNARVLWTTTAPLDLQAPDLDRFMVLEARRKSGDALSGNYEAIIPNPVVADPSGSVKTIYYVVEASDADPPLGCAHRTVSPLAGVYSFRVKRP